MSGRKNRYTLQQWLARFFLIFSVVMFMSMKLYVHFQVDLLMRDIRLLETQRNQLQSQREELSAKVNRLQNIDRITRIAEQQLHLVSDPEPQQAIRLEDVEELDVLRARYASKQKEIKEYTLAGVK